MGKSFFDELIDGLAEGVVRGLIQGWTGERDGFCKECNRRIRYNINKHGSGPHYCQKCADKIPGFNTQHWTNKRGDVGKILTDENEPGRSTHIHKHPDGITISTYEEDPTTGKEKPIGRYNFNTGEDETPKK